MNQSNEPDLDPSAAGEPQIIAPIGALNAEGGDEHRSPRIVKGSESCAGEAAQYPGETAIRRDRALLASGQVQDSNLSLLTIASS